MKITSRVVSLRFLIWLYILVALCAVIWIRYWLDAPPLSVQRRNQGVWINVATLGEYPTMITHVRISTKATKDIVWDLRAEEGEYSQARGFLLQIGPNPVHPKTFGARYVVTVPRDSTTFTLLDATQYQIEVWRKGDRSVESFQIATQ